MNELNQPCVCGHIKMEHEFTPYEIIKGKNGEDSYCRKCQWVPLTNRQQAVHKFKLDNLSYVEQVAKAKGLI